MEPEQTITGLCGIITVILIGLKLFGLINVSWWVATCLVWIPFVLIGAGLGVAGLIEYFKNR